MKKILIAFLSFAGAAALFTAIGQLYRIPWLSFEFSLIINENGLSLSAGSFMPLLIGLAASFLAEKLYEFRISHSVSRITK
ncbi:hypothetical protein [Metabacillus sp. 84]|uniref:hypothetical protein n=1 Tax=unclassified Metabacillus TaxID=2675274 RepID=UPI003CF33152